MTRNLIPLEDRFWAKVEKGNDTDCWLWKGAKIPNGYGQIRVNKTTHILAHRLSYEIHCGPIPEGLTIDHLCRVRNCVNPKHLEPVTRGENTLRGEGVAAQNARKTHCPKGHPYKDDNLYIYPEGSSLAGYRRCKFCNVNRSIHE